MPRTLQDGTSLPAYVSHTSFPRIQLYGRLCWLHSLWIPRPTVSQTGVLVLLWVPVNLENACYYQFKIFCLPVCYLETRTLKYNLQNYNFVWCLTCVWNWSLILREENLLGMFENRFWERSFRLRDREKATEVLNKISNVHITWCCGAFAYPSLKSKDSTAVCEYSWTTSHCRQYKNTECCKKMILWRIYVAGSNKTHLG